MVDDVARGDHRFEVRVPAAPARAQLVEDIVDPLVAPDREVVERLAVDELPRRYRDVLAERLRARQRAVAGQPRGTGLEAREVRRALGGELKVYLNEALVDVDGLSALTTVGRDLRVFSNFALRDVEGLRSLSAVGGSFSLLDNVTTVQGLRSLRTVGGYLALNFNGQVTDLGGLENLASVGGLSLDNLAQLSDQSPAKRPEP